MFNKKQHQIQLFNCIKHTKTLINIHNENILKQILPTNISNCNGGNKETFLLTERFKIVGVIYEGTISISQSDYKKKKYYVVTKKCFKASLYNHRKSG